MEKIRKKYDEDFKKNAVKLLYATRSRTAVENMITAYENKAKVFMFSTKRLFSDFFKSKIDWCCSPKI